MADEIFELKGKVSIDTSDLDKATKSIKKAVDGLSTSTKTSSVKKEAAQTADAYKQVESTTSEIAENIKAVEKVAKKTSAELNKMFEAYSKMMGYDKSKQGAYGKSSIFAGMAQSPKEVIDQYLKPQQQMVATLQAAKDQYDKSVRDTVKANIQANRDALNAEYNANSAFNQTATQQELEALWKPDYTSNVLGNIALTRQGLTPRGVQGKGNSEEDILAVWGTPIDSLRRKLEEIKKPLEEAKKKAKESTKEFSKLFGQFKRIATYRLIRTALKAIGGTAKEGVNNLYQYSKLTGNGTFAKAMDSIATSVNYIKNSVGTALAPIITALAPVIDKLATSFNSLCEQVARFFALLTGQNGYYKVATKQAKEYAQAQRQILGFDELNILGNNNGATDVSSAFVWQEGFGEMSNFELKIQELGLNIGKIVTENLDTIVVGVALVDAILGTVGLFNLKGNITNLTASIAGIGIILAYTGIKNIMSAQSVDDKEFWVGLKQLANSAGFLTGVIMKAFIGASALQSGLVALSVGIMLNLAIESVKFKTDANAQIIDRELQSLVDQGKISATTKVASQNFTMAAYGFADGGVPAKGSLFIAGESGAELVSDLGGRTQVFNDTQLIGELSVANEGVISAVMQAANAIVSSVSNMPSPTIKIGDRDIYNASKRGSKIVGESLIQGV